MSIELNRTKRVYEVIREIATNGHSNFQPGDVGARLREENQPLGTWEIRGEFSILEAEGRIVLNPESGAWTLNDNAPGAAERKAS